jgi:Tfp pilus assembly protein PilP
MLNVHWRLIVSAMGLSLMLLAIVGCGQSSQPLPDIDATVEARVTIEHSKKATTIALIESSVEATVQARMQEEPDKEAVENETELSSQIKSTSTYLTTAL